MSDSLVCEYTLKDSVPLRHYHNSKKSSASPHRFQKYTFFLFLESGNLSLEEQPYRGAERKYGCYAFKGYRQLIVENYIIIYEVLENEKVVAVVTVKYGKSEF